jgi:hypothetical protein
MPEHVVGFGVLEGLSQLSRFIDYKWHWDRFIVFHLYFSQVYVFFRGRKRVLMTVNDEKRVDAPLSRAPITRLASGIAPIVPADPHHFGVYRGYLG